MKVIRTPEEMLSWSREHRADGKRVGVVPTMGYLHEGHLSLIRIARENADAVVVTLFVNPTQFGPHEDLSRYPRDEVRDQALCEAEMADVLFIPDVSDMYAGDASVRVVEEKLSRGLCGESRPGHFGGVVTVVTKLFNIVDPDIAVFGEKDAQQLRIIRRLVRDLNYSIRIIPGPIVREDDGLAMSSRNRLLRADERKQAAQLFQSLELAKNAFAEGERDAQKLKDLVRSSLGRASLGKIDYVELVDDETLEEIALIKGRALLAVAVNFSTTRIIDNTTLGE